MNWPNGREGRGRGVRCHCCCCSTSKLNKRKHVIFKGGGRGKYLNCMRCVLQVIQRSREAVRVVVWSTLCQKRKKNTGKRSSLNSVEIGNAFHIPTPPQVIVPALWSAVVSRIREWHNGRSGYEEAPKFTQPMSRCPDVGRIDQVVRRKELRCGSNRPPCGTNKPTCPKNGTSCGANRTSCRKSTPRCEANNHRCRANRLRCRAEDLT